MAWRMSLGAFGRMLRQHVSSVAETQRKEGQVHERVRLYEAAHTDLTAKWHPFVRAKAAACWRVVEEARAHMETARQFSLASAWRANREIDTLRAAYEEALDALERIAKNGHDPVEIASQAMDKAEARLASYAPEESEETPPLAVTLSLDADPLRAQLRDMESQLRALSEELQPDPTQLPLNIVDDTGVFEERVILNAHRSGVIERRDGETIDEALLRDKTEMRDDG